MCHVVSFIPPIPFTFARSLSLPKKTENKEIAMHGHSSTDAREGIISEAIPLFSPLIYHCGTFPSCIFFFILAPLNVFHVRSVAFVAAICRDWTVAGGIK